MISIKDANAKEMWAVFYCEECEAQTGVPTEYRIDYSNRGKEERNRRKEKTRRFDRLHSRCGLREVNARLKKAYPKFFSDMELDDGAW